MLNNALQDYSLEITGSIIMVSLLNLLLNVVYLYPWSLVYHSVTVLLCVLFCLLCTVYLRVLLASLPLLILCFNKYFFRSESIHSEPLYIYNTQPSLGTVELWKTLFGYVYRKVLLKSKG